jgi:hypothetical protein
MITVGLPIDLNSRKENAGNVQAVSGVTYRR